MDNPEKIKCPIITVWIFFILNIFYTDSHILYDNHRNTFSRFFYIIFTTILIITILIDLIGCIFITISFENNKYSFYLTGLIVIIVFNVLMTSVIILYGSRSFLIFNILQIIADWSQLIVLLVYNKRVKSSFKHSHLNDNLIKEFPKEVQPLRQTKEQIEEEKDIYI